MEPEATLIHDLHSQLTVEKIHLSKNYPCMLDNNDLGCKSGVYCHCENRQHYNTEFYTGANGQKLKNMLKQCFRCKRYVHEDCQEAN